MGFRPFLVGLAITLLSATALVGHPRPVAAADEGAPNACGCRQTAVGLCFCDKKARCGCPGECEPKGCEEKRAKLLEKEIQAETKKAAEADRKREGNNMQERSSTARVDPERSAVREAKAAREKKLTSTQKRELSRLLELYVGENPDRRSWTVEKIAADVSR
jgi:hypothetical protein